MSFLTLFALCLHVMNVTQPLVHQHTEAAFVTALGFMSGEKISRNEKESLAYVLATEKDESSFDIFAVGDSGKSCGPMQVLNGCKLSPVQNIVEGMRQIREASLYCPEAPFAAYVGGPRGCHSERLVKLNSHRMQNVHWIEGILQ